jgi:hypothetical protein
LSVKALRTDMGGLGLATPQNYDWLPEERLQPVSREVAHELAERMVAAKEDGVYRAGNKSPTPQTHSGKIR